MPPSLSSEELGVGPPTHRGRSELLACREDVRHLIIGEIGELGGVVCGASACVTASASIERAESRSHDDARCDVVRVVRSPLPLTPTPIRLRLLLLFRRRLQLRRRLTLGNYEAVSARDGADVHERKDRVRL
jgi:hypothetical protein